MQRLLAMFAAAALAHSAGTALAADAAQQLQNMMQQMRQASQATADKRAAAAQSLASQIQGSALAKAAAPKGLTSAQFAKLQAIRGKIAANPQTASATMGEWKALMSDKSMKGKDVNAMVMYALQQHAQATAKDLRAQADKVRDVNEKKAKLRQMQEELRKQASAKPPGSAARDQLEAKLKQLQAQVRPLDELGQMQQLQLQQAMQRQQQAMQTLSNISKQMHDTAKSIIGNLK